MRGRISRPRNRRSCKVWQSQWIYDLRVEVVAWRGKLAFPLGITIINDVGRDHELWQEVSNLKHMVFQPANDFRYASQRGSAHFLSRLADLKKKVNMHPPRRAQRQGGGIEQHQEAPCRFDQCTGWPSEARRGHIQASGQDLGQNSLKAWRVWRDGRGCRWRSGKAGWIGFGT